MAHHVKFTRTLWDCLGGIDFWLSAGTQFVAMSARFLFSVLTMSGFVRARALINAGLKWCCKYRLVWRPRLTQQQSKGARRVALYPGAFLPDEKSRILCTVTIASYNNQFCLMTTSADIAAHAISV